MRLTVIGHWIESSRGGRLMWGGYGFGLGRCVLAGRNLGLHSLYAIREAVWTASWTNKARRVFLEGWPKSRYGQSGGVLYITARDMEHCHKMVDYFMRICMPQRCMMYSPCMDGNLRWRIGLRRTTPGRRATAFVGQNFGRPRTSDVLSMRRFGHYRQNRRTIFRKHPPR